MRERVSWIEKQMDREIERLRWGERRNINIKKKKEKYIKIHNTYR